MKLADNYLGANYYTYNVCMTFEYDPQKAQTNWQKHNVSFAEAEFVFYDPLAIHDIDPDATDEERFIAVGMGNSGLLLVVVYHALRAEVRSQKSEVRNR